MLATIGMILPVFLLVLTGFGIGKAGVLPPQAGELLSRFVTWVALPALMIDVMATTDWTRTWDSGFVVASLGGSFLLLGIGMLLGRLRGLSFADMAIDGLNASYSNTAYAGLPLLLLVLGPRSTPLVMIAAAITLMALFATGVILIELGHNHKAGLGGALAKAGIGVVRNPVIVSTVIGTLWWFSGIPVPAPIARFLAMLGGVASPTALFAIGLFLAATPLRLALASGPVWRLTVAKLLVHPAATAFLAYRVLDLPPFTALVVTAIAALPTGTGPFMVASFYARDERVTTGTVLLTTILSALTLSALLSFVPHG
ncbi:AEC family transporter [Sphingobium subterraneum]|uniref:Auxin efflux carrier n=1 Tax=Sphingobium subterraneum TaxID=627688 RepID=A0A841IZ91_9SPHN|nr:AEC family transporter [Sphingobium subterraneum]MBB6124279.1 hypothetical protein [Sphingobium subterraneum]